jgi:hypothetical protein
VCPSVVLTDVFGCSTSVLCVWAGRPRRYAADPRDARPKRVIVRSHALGITRTETSVEEADLCTRVQRRKFVLRKNRPISAYPPVVVKESENEDRDPPLRRGSEFVLRRGV